MLNVVAPPAQVAQLVEQLTNDPKFEGSNPDAAAQCENFKFYI